MLRVYEQVLCGGQKQIGLRRFVNGVLKKEDELAILVNTGLNVIPDVSPYNRVDFFACNVNVHPFLKYVKRHYLAVWTPYSITVRCLSSGARMLFKDPYIIDVGGFKAVVRYHDAKTHNCLALKIEGAPFARVPVPLPLEKDISVVTNKNSAITQVKFIETRGLFRKSHFYVMDCLDGHCLNLLGLLQHKNSRIPHKRVSELWLKMVEEVRKQVVWLLQKGFVYTDLKSQNVLYSIHPQKGISFHLGDLGSAVPNSEGKQHTANVWIPNIGATATVVDPTDRQHTHALLLYLLGHMAARLADDWVHENFLSSLENYTYLSHAKKQKQKYNTDLKTYLQKSKFSSKQKTLLSQLLAWDEETRLGVDLEKPFVWW